MPPISLACFLLLSSVAWAAPYPNSSIVPAAVVEPSPGEAPKGAIEDMSLEDLLNMDTEVASHKSISLREAPGVITVITAEEIDQLGARDLIDVLHGVTGFTFVQDVENVTDAGFRSIWGHEGKILLLYDGLEMNEPLYSTLQMGNHFPLNNVARIEVIRGPGSVIYGGNAELAVINIVSRDAVALHGFRVRGEYGQMLRDFARRGVEAAWGDVFPRAANLAITASVKWGQGNRSEDYFHDFNGSTPYRGIDNNARLDPLFANVSLNIENLRLRLIYDRYAITDRYPYDTILDTPLAVGFTTYGADAQYVWHITDSVVVTPRLNYKRQTPWYEASDSAASLATDFYDKYNERMVGNLTASWDIIESLNLLAGVQGTIDYAHQRIEPNMGGVNVPFSNGGNTYLYKTFAVFAQMLWDNPWVNITGGARFENNSVFGSSFVPRLVLTKVFDPFHVKALVSQAFRAPAIENIHLNSAIKPEYLTVYELEAGWVITDLLYLGLNLYDMTSTNTIVYTTDNDDEIYDNFKHTGSRGLEVEVRLKGSVGWATVGYSFSTAAGKNAIPTYAVPQTDSMLLGMPMHKLTATGALKLGEHVILGPSMVLLGPRYGFLNTAGVVDRTSTIVLLNLFATYKNLGVAGLDLSLGLYNILGQSFSFIQPYNSYVQGVSNGRAPIPGLSRELLVRLTYAFAE